MTNQIKKMINIISPNPALEAHYVWAGEIGLDGTSLEKKTEQAGGNGINLARWLRKQDVKHRVFTILGGFNGYKLKAFCKKEQIKLKYVLVKPETRENFVIEKQNKKLKYDTFVEALSKREISEYSKMLLTTEFKGKVFVFSGSLPNGFGQDQYLELMQALVAKVADIKIVLDLKRPFLQKVIQEINQQIFLVKINQHEWEEWSGENWSEKAFKDFAAKMKKQVENIVVTDAENAEGDFLAKFIAKV